MRTEPLGDFIRNETKGKDKAIINLQKRAQQIYEDGKEYLRESAVVSHLLSLKLSVTLAVNGSKL